MPRGNRGSEIRSDGSTTRDRRVAIVGRASPPALVGSDDNQTVLRDHENFVMLLLDYQKLRRTTIDDVVSLTYQGKVNLLLVNVVRVPAKP